MRIYKPTPACTLAVELFGYRILFSNYWKGSDKKFIIQLSKLKKLQCPHCSKTFEYDKDDIHFHPDVYERAYMSRSGYKFIWCPKCKGSFKL